jgi:hypothetical protein
VPNTFRWNETHSTAVRFRFTTRRHAKFLCVAEQRLPITPREAYGPSLEDKKLQCPNFSQPMLLKRIQTSEAERPSFAHYECKPCGVGFSEALDDDDPGKQTLQ